MLIEFNNIFLENLGRFLKTIKINYYRINFLERYNIILNLNQSLQTLVCQSDDKYILLADISKNDPPVISSHTVQ